MTRWKHYLALPTLGLQLFRRGLGVVCLIDALSRASDASFFLSDLGVLPRSLYYSLFEEHFFTSVLLISGQPIFTYLAFILGVCLSIGHILGKSNRLSRSVLWLVVLSIQYRNPGVNDASDTLLRLCLLWDVFLPTTTESPAVVSMATLGLQCQLTLTLVATSMALGPQSVQLSARWAGESQWAYPAWFGTGEQIVFGLLAIAVWFRPVRLAVLIAATPFLVIRALAFHPIFPLTLAVALSSICTFNYRCDEENLAHTNKGPSRRRLIFSRVLAAIAIATSLTSALPLPIWVKATSRPIAEICGLEQDWDRVYPLAATTVAEVLARDRLSNAPRWSIGMNDSRRRRLLAQKISENGTWSQGLPVALKEKVSLDMEPVLWISIQTFGPQLTLGIGEYRLLSATPVLAPVRGVTP